MATNIEAMTGGTPNIRVKASARTFQGVAKVILAKVALTEASIAAQVGSQVDVAVPGVEFGDFVFVSYPADLTGLILSAFVQAAGVVTITAYNIEGTDAVTALSGGLTANLFVLKPVFDAAG